MTARIKILFSSLALTLAAAGLAQPAAAQTAIAAGAKVADPQGGEVGTVTAVDGEFLVVKTDKHEVRLPKASFTATDEVLLFGLTQAQLNAEIEKSQVNPADLLKAGAVIRDTAGGLVGTVEGVEADLVTVKLEELSVKLPVSAFAANQEGLLLGMTAAELEAQAAAATATATATN